MSEAAAERGRTGEKQTAGRKTGKSAPPTERKRREPTQREIAQRERQRARNSERDERPEAKIIQTPTGGDKVNVTITCADNQDEQLHGVAMLEALGTRSLPFLNDTLDNIRKVLSRSGIATEQQYNSALAILAAVEPQNELEATLASQMVAANECAFRCMQGMKASDWTDQHKMYGDMANKFMRTFTTQLETLTRLRRDGEQVVKHVYVQEGGQAVIAGTVNTGGRESLGGVEQPYGASTAPRITPLPGPDPTRDGVPIPGDAEREVSHSRREESGCPKRQSQRLEARK